VAGASRPSGEGLARWHGGRHLRQSPFSRARRSKTAVATIRTALAVLQRVPRVKKHGRSRDGAGRGGWGNALFAGHFAAGDGTVATPPPTELVNSANSRLGQDGLPLAQSSRSRPICKVNSARVSSAQDRRSSALTALPGAEGSRGPCAAPAIRQAACGPRCRPSDKGSRPRARTDRALAGVQAAPASLRGTRYRTPQRTPSCYQISPRSGILRW